MTIIQKASGSSWWSSRSVNIALIVGPGWCPWRQIGCLRECQRGVPNELCFPVCPLDTLSVFTPDCDWWKLCSFRGSIFSIVQGKSFCISMTWTERPFLSLQVTPSRNAGLTLHVHVGKLTEYGFKALKMARHSSLPTSCGIPTLAFHSLVLSIIGFLGFLCSMQVWRKELTYRLDSCPLKGLLTSLVLGTW